MTCIAYDGYMIACDGIGTTETGFQGGNADRIKIYNFKDLWVGFCGSNEELHVEVVSMLEALYRGTIKRGNKIVRPDTGSTVSSCIKQMQEWGYQTDIDAIVIDSEFPEKVWVWSSKQPRGFCGETAPFALGSGGTYAMGAMLAGASALDAVKIASLLDAFTGGNIIVESVAK